MAMHCVLQLSHSERAVWHAAVGFVLVRARLLYRKHRLALQQYDRAMKLVDSSRSLDTA